MRDSDVDAVIGICSLVYPDEAPYSIDQLLDHCQIFREGQFVIEHEPSGEVAGIQATLIVHWSDYGDEATWERFTADGTFLNHDPVHGHTLYGAEMMVHPKHQHHGLSRVLIEETRALVRARGLSRIRAGSRIPGYHLHADRMSPEEYVAAVGARRLADPVLPVHLSEGWSLFGVAHAYLPTDTESRGAAALIEWRNPAWTPPGP
jgi:GNAT superfamily N-acetyltransferase